MRNLGLAVLVAAAVAVFCTCGCSDSTDKIQSPEQGEVTIVLTDAPSDDIAVFEVDVTEIALKAASGAVVYALPRRQRVDFAQLTDAGQLLVGRRLPAGFYTDVTMTLDFSTAVVMLQEETTPAALFDAGGNPLTGTMAVRVVFGPNNRPNIIIRRNRLFVFDFNLDASTIVDTIANSVTVRPIINAVVDPTNPKPIITTGRLVSADAATGQIVLSIRNPRTDEEIAEYTVHTWPWTAFHVDGNPYSNLAGAGIAALASLPADARVWVHSIWEQLTVGIGDKVVKAYFVEAGLGVPGSGQDWCQGLITARTGGEGADPTLTVQGCTYKAGTPGTWSFNQEITMDASFAGSKVLHRGSVFSLNTDYLNVGQRITVYGDLTGTTMDATGTANGIIRCIRTDIFGFASGPLTDNKLTIELKRIGLRPIALFDFVVDGTVQAATDAFVAFTLVDASTVGASTPVKLRGFVAPVGTSAALPDFTADTVIDRSAVASLLICEWSPADENAISPAAGSISMDLTGTVYAKVDWGFVAMADLDPADPPEIVPMFGLGIYLIHQAGTNEVYLSFEAFSDALVGKLGPAGKVYQVFALGKYDNTPGLQKLSASSVVVVLE